MADITLLRTLTEKSKLKFGRFYMDTVDDVIQRDPGLLVFYYYAKSAISFTDDVLSRINIGPDRRIAKPGCLSNPDLNERVNAVRDEMRSAMKESMGERAYMNMFNKKRAEFRKSAIGRMKKQKVTKGRMQSVNQGHR